MELRDPGCRFCQRSTSGDCGKHGAKIVQVGDLEGDNVQTPPIFPKMQTTLVEEATRVFHFVCATNGDHQMYVHAQQGAPPEPTICPWRCGWMTLTRLTGMVERPASK